MSYSPQQTCCFTGHRRLPSSLLPALASQLDIAVRQAAAQGFCRFCAGGAWGFDALAAQAVLRLRAERADVQLALILPCRDQAATWPISSQQRYHAMLAQADEVEYISDTYQNGCMQRRNRRLIEQSTLCIAFCQQTTGGTAYTVAQARRAGVTVINLAHRLRNDPTV